MFREKALDSSLSARIVEHAAGLTHVSILPYSSCDVRETIGLLIFWPIMNDNLPVKSMNSSICKV